MYLLEKGQSQKETILFLHGMLTSSWMWEGLIEHLSQDYHCIAPDLPSHGKSHDIPAKSMDAIADELAHIIQERAHGGKAHVVGLSFGGMLTVKLLERHPHLLKTAIVSGVNALPIPNLRLMRLMSAIMLPLSGLDFFIKMSSKAMNITGADYEGYYQSLKQVNAGALKGLYGQALEFSIPANLSTVDNHALFVAGSGENPVVIESVTALASFMPNGVGAIVPDVSHAWIAEAPELFAKMVKAWIEGKSLPDELQIVHQAQNEVILASA